MGVQIAKVLGAAHVITAATGDGIALAKSLGAEAVADYKVGWELGHNKKRFVFRVIMNLSFFCLLLLFFFRAMGC